MAFAVTASTFVGVVVWLILGHRTPMWLLLACPPLLAIVMLWRDGEMRRWLRNHKQGAEGEELVGNRLDEQLSNAYRVLHDVEMTFGNVDHVVIGPTGAFAIETKAWTGRAQLDATGKLTVDGWDQDRAFAQATRGGTWAHRQFADAGVDIWVEAVIVLTHTDLSGTPLDRRSVRIVSLDELVPLIHEGRHPLSEDAIDKGASAIQRARSRKT